MNRKQRRNNVKFAKKRKIEVSDKITKFYREQFGGEPKVDDRFKYKNPKTGAIEDWVVVSVKPEFKARKALIIT